MSLRGGASPDAAVWSCTLHCWGFPGVPLSQVIAVVPCGASHDKFGERASNARRLQKKAQQNARQKNRVKRSQFPPVKKRLLTTLWLAYLERMLPSWSLAMTNLCSFFPVSLRVGTIDAAISSGQLRIRRRPFHVTAASCDATAPAEPCNDKLGSAFFPCHCEEGASPTRQSREGSCEFAGGLPMLRLHPARLPRLLRSLEMTNLGVPSSRVIARRAQARRGNLGKAVANSPEAFPCYGCILRDCHGSCGASQ